MSKRVHVAVGVVRRADEVLIARRADERHQGGLLEFPGGKVERGEAVRRALVRELAEEVAIDADPAQMRPLIQIRHDYPDKEVLLDVWQVPAFTGIPKGLEGQPVRWMTISALRDSDFPAGNRAIIRALQLPREWLITGPCSDDYSLASRLSRTLPRAASSGLLLRQPSLSRRAYLETATVALDLCQKHRIPLMLHGDLELLQDIPAAAGVHLPQHASTRLGKTVMPKGKWLGISCHSLDEIVRAGEIGADYAFLSPVCPTNSHPGEPRLGWAGFAGLARRAPMPVYALGGVGPTDIETSRNSGGQGIAGISYWWI